MTGDQFVLLQDKVALWRKASTEGSMELRDYNRRAGEALTAALVERVELLEALQDLVRLEGGRFGTGVIKPGTYGAAVMGAAREAIAKAEGRS